MSLAGRSTPEEHALIDAFSFSATGSPSGSATLTVSREPISSESRNPDSVPMAGRRSNAGVFSCRYLNPKGVIPASAVFQKGQNPERPRAVANGAGAAGEADAAMTVLSDDEGLAPGEEEG